MLLPLTVVLGAEWGVTGAAVAVLVSTLAFAATWAMRLARVRADLGRPVEQVPGGATLT